MYRRRRPPERAALFSFDSFLDVVANVIGIVIRLILVAWVGSRLYKGPAPPPVPLPTEVQVAAFVPPAVEDPLADEITRQNEELARSREKALAALRGWETARSQRTQAEQSAQQVRQERESLERRPPEAPGLEAPQMARQQAEAALASLRERHARIQAELDVLKKTPAPMPAPTRQLAFRLPISAVVQTEELFFECRRNRVTVIDVASMLDEVKDNLRNKGKELKTKWEVEDSTSAQGAFRMRYLVERERGVLEAGAPNPDASFNYGVSRWVCEPVQDDRGESVEQALKADSAFRKLVDGLSPNQVVVTLWVYPDSFAIYRELRNYLHDRDLVVAGRPLPEGMPIASSRRGTSSRGQ